MDYVTMYDSIRLDQIPADAEAVAGYVGGAWPTAHLLPARFPHAHVLTIAVGAQEDADCLDVETGDATPEQGPAWLLRQLKRGIDRVPVLYCSESVMPSLIAAMNRAGIHRGRYLIWSAHYTGVAHIDPGADATQWYDKAHGRNLDVSLCAPDFFPTAPSRDPLDVLTLAERRVVNTYDHYVKHPHLHANGLKMTREDLVVKRKEVWEAAVRGRANGKDVPWGWGVRNRQARYDILWQRTEGKDHA